jgi:peptidoglycan/LPS O-acetylase OafA/YrhL
MMMERNTRIQFLANRFFRIFPTLVVATLATGLIAFCFQKIVFEPRQYAASWSLTYQFLSITPVSGVLWTLVVEVVFYLIVFVLGRLNRLKLAFLQIFMILVIIFAGSNVQTLTVLSTIARYVLIICIGVSFYFVWRRKATYASVVLSVILSFFGGALHSQLALPDLGNYSSMGNHVAAVGIFAGFMMLSKQINLPSPIKSLANVV